MLGKIIFALCLVAVTALDPVPTTSKSGYQCFSCADMNSCKYFQDRYSSNVKTETCTYGCYVKVESYGGSQFVTRGCYYSYMMGQDGLQPCYSQYDYCNNWDIPMTASATGNFAFPALLTACILLVKAIF